MKRLIVILFIIFGAFLTFSLYRTFAYDTSVVEEVPSTTDLEYTFKIGNSSIKQITVDSGETRYYDIVLGNPNNAKISYSVYYEMVSPSTKPDDYKIEYTSKSTGNSTGIVGNNGNITLNIVVTNTSSNAVTVKVGTVAGYVKGGELALNSGQEVIPKKGINAVTFINSLDDGTTGDSGSGVYKVTHDAIPASSSATGSEIPAVTDYRYYGSSPNNYVCLDNSSGTCEDRHLYRIIGSIYEELSGQNLIKVIKATPLTDGSIATYKWDSGNVNIWATITSGNYSNSLTSGASLMKLLNSEDWWTSRNSYANYGLTSKAKSYVTTSRYYLGGTSVSNGETLKQFYSYERGTERYDASRPLYWDGNVGLMYPSDYGYAAGNRCATVVDIYNYRINGECRNNDWLFNNKDEWLMMPNSNALDISFLLLSTGGLFDISTEYFPVSYDCLIRPTFYLTSTTSITSGTGTSSDPYIISK